MSALSEGCPVSSWTSIYEGRDQQLGGASFIWTEGPTGRGPDVYVGGPPLQHTPDGQDLIAAARTYLPQLLFELGSNDVGPTIDRAALQTFLKLSDSYPTDKWEFVPAEDGVSAHIRTDGPAGQGDDIFLYTDADPAPPEYVELAAVARTYVPELARAVLLQR
jgi:hypothetical protein